LSHPPSCDATSFVGHISNAHLATPLPGEVTAAAAAYRLDLARRDTDSDDDVRSTVYATVDGSAAGDANKAGFSQAGTGLGSEGIGAVAAEAEDAVVAAATPTMTVAASRG
jgi:hypothetical protein